MYVRNQKTKDQLVQRLLCFQEYISCYLLIMSQTLGNTKRMKAYIYINSLKLKFNCPPPPPAQQWTAEDTQCRRCAVFNTKNFC